MITKELLELPMEVEFEGIVFSPEIVWNGSDELRLCYKISYLLEGSKHTADYQQHGSWWNILANKEDPPFQGFLILYENINTDADLIWAVRDCWRWLCRNNLLK